MGCFFQQSIGGYRGWVRLGCCVLLVFGVALFGVGGGVACADFPYEQEPINYNTAKTDDCFAKLQKRIESREVTLKFDAQHGYLPALLKELKIPTSSQTLVFSKTSFQRSKIAPHAPRALYFNDEAYVGYCQKGDLLELAAIDARQGTIFYSLDQREVEQPKMVRQSDSCLVCHSTGRTGNVPGLVVRSVFPEPGGEPVYRAGTFDVDHTTPLEKRWGGWYVSGTHGKQLHMGNALLKNSEDPNDFDRSVGSNKIDLSTLFDPSPYLSPHSDLVALMVLEHQTRMQNLLTRANFETRSALWYNAEMNKAFEQPSGFRSESTERRIRRVAEDVVAYMLFADEAAISEGLAGVSNFAKEFSAVGPRDSQGRSLREFDLQRRLFKYPCSFLIYSPQFDGLPPEVKTVVFEELLGVLRGKNTNAKFAHLSASDRTAILEILCATKPNLPPGFQSERASP